MRKVRRIIKNLFEGRRKRVQINLDGILLMVTIFAVGAFILTHLVTNAILSPLGHKLQALNSEKNLLIEKNREVEQEIAKNTSLVIIQKYSEADLAGAERTGAESIFVTDHSIQALR